MLRRVDAQRSADASRRTLLVIAWSLAVLGLLWTEAEPAWAHNVVIGQSKIRKEGDVVRYDLAINYDELMKRTGSDWGDSLTSSTQAKSDAEREAVLRAAQVDLWSYVGSHVKVLLDGVNCGGTLDAVDVLRFRGELFAVMSLAYRCRESATGSYEIHYDLFFDSLSDAERTSQANIADYDFPGVNGRLVFEPGNERLSLSDGGNQNQEAGGPSALSSARSFVALGFEHILAGVDHVLFILVLLLGARSLRDVLKVVTAFTLAHSVTLGLAATGWVSVPAGIVEPLIALSIAYVAIENIFREGSSHRTLVAFGFGLLHGLGFAGAITFTDHVGWGLVPPLFSFNLGIEAGQALIIVLVWPLILLARRLSWQRIAQLAASTLIAGFGAFWFLERLVLI